MFNQCLSKTENDKLKDILHKLLENKQEATTPNANEHYAVRRN